MAPKKYQPGAMQAKTAHKDPSPATPQQEQPSAPAPQPKGKGGKQPTSPTHIAKQSSSSQLLLAPEAPPMALAVRTKTNLALSLVSLPPSTGKSVPSSPTSPKQQGDDDDIATASLTAKVSNIGSALEGDFSECDDLVYSNDGKFFATANQETVFVVHAMAGEVAFTISEPKVKHVCFSPQGTFLVTYRATTPGMKEGNLAIWRLAKSGASEGAAGEDCEAEEKKPQQASAAAKKAAAAAAVQLTDVAFRFVQNQWPALNWTADEKFLVRSAQGVIHVYHGSLSSTEIIERLAVELPQTKHPRLAPSSSASAPFLAFFLPWHGKRLNGELSVFRLPEIKQPLMTTTFGKADMATITWAPNGKFLTITTQTETDKSGGSFYGVTTLRVVNVGDRTTANISLGAGDQVHDCQWSPTNNEFIVVHGPMPKNKMTLFNANGEALFQFGEAPRNCVRWAPNGKFFFATGTGNMAGELQMYDRTMAGKKTGAAADGKLGYFVEKCSSQQWCPDSRHVITTTVFSKLRLANKFIIWKYTGEKVHEAKFDELYNASFTPMPTSAFADRDVSPGATMRTEEAAKPTAFRARGSNQATIAALARSSGAANAGHAVKPKSAGPVGASVAVPEKKKKR